MKRRNFIKGALAALAVPFVGFRKRAKSAGWRRVGTIVLVEPGWKPKEVTIVSKARGEGE